jgi:hypothetical protein
MDSNHGSGEPAAFEADLIHQQLGALTDASRQRHRLEPGSAEYDAALEIEERIAEHVWQLATVLGPSGPRSGPAVRQDPET